MSAHCIHIRAMICNQNTSNIVSHMCVGHTVSERTSYYYILNPAWNHHLKEASRFETSSGTEYRDSECVTGYLLSRCECEGRIVSGPDSECSFHTIIITSYFIMVWLWWSCIIFIDWTLLSHILRIFNGTIKDCINGLIILEFVQRHPLLASLAHFCGEGLPCCGHTGGYSCGSVCLEFGHLSCRVVGEDARLSD